MKLIAYAQESAVVADRFLEGIALLGNDYSAHRYTTIRDLLQSMQRPITERLIITLFINNIIELQQIDSQKGAFRSNPLLFLLNETNEDNISLCHRIGARFVGDAATDGAILIQIVSKMMTLYQRLSESEQKT